MILFPIKVNDYFYSMAKKSAKSRDSKVGKPRSNKVKVRIPKKRSRVRSAEVEKTINANDTIRFTGILEKRDKMGGGHFVRVPNSVTKHFGKKGIVRVLGTMNGVEIDRALIPNGEGGHEIIIGTAVRKKTKVEEGGKVVVEIYRNPNPDEVDIPEELLVAIEMEPEAQRKFEKMTPGMKRNMASWVGSGKLPETRAKRAVEILNRIMSGAIFGGKKLE